MSPRLRLWGVWEGLSKVTASRLSTAPLGPRTPHLLCVLSVVTRPGLQEAAGGEAGPCSGRDRLLLAPTQAKLPNLKEVDVRYTEAW